jgi:hypothetical protein
VGVSSASIPAISFVITAIIPARNHPGNEVRSELPIVARSKADQKQATIHPRGLLQIVRNYKKERGGCC